jgi:hypothetical protein
MLMIIFTKVLEKEMRLYMLYLGNRLFCFVYVTLNLSWPLLNVMLGDGADKLSSCILLFEFLPLRVRTATEINKRDHLHM